MTCTHCNKPEPDCDCETMAGIYEAAGKAGDEMYVLLRDGMYYRRDGEYTGRLKDARRFSRDTALRFAGSESGRFSALPVSTAPRHAPKCDPHVIALDLKADADKALEAERAARVAAEVERDGLARSIEALTPYAKLGLACAEGWPDEFGDIDAFDLFDMLKDSGVIVKQPEPYDPDKDGYIEDCEKGDDWYKRAVNTGNVRAALGKETT